MSCIYFHSPNGDIKISGAERAYMANMIGDISWSVIEHLAANNLHEKKRPLICPLLPKDHYLSTINFNEILMDFSEAVKTWFRVNMTDGHFIINDEKRDIFDLQLNTVWKMSSDPIRLFVRLHGQCECHCYVEGKNRQWLADIIRQGRCFLMYRNSMGYDGWDKLERFLRENSNEPVVCSYSVCEQFPNPNIAGWMDEMPENIDEEDEDDRYDKFYKLSKKKRWAKAMEALRKRNEEVRFELELKPDDWDDPINGFKFGDGYDLFKVVEYCNQLHFGHPDQKGGRRGAV